MTTLLLTQTQADALRDGFVAGDFIADELDIKYPVDQTKAVIDYFMQQVLNGTELVFNSQYEMHRDILRCAVNLSVYPYQNQFDWPELEELELILSEYGIHTKFKGNR